MFAVVAATLRELAIKSALNSQEPFSLSLSPAFFICRYSLTSTSIFYLERISFLPLVPLFFFLHLFFSQIPSAFLRFKMPLFISPVRHKGACRQEPKMFLQRQKAHLQAMHTSVILAKAPTINRFLLSLFSKTHQCHLLIRQSPSLLYPTLSPIPLSVHISLAVSSF